MNVILQIVCALLSASCAQASHSFYTPRQVTTDPTFELALTDFRMFHADDAKHFQLYIKPFFQLTNSPDKIAAYFLPNSCACAHVREDGSGDINPLWFNLISEPGTMYSSTLCFAPQRATYGGVLTCFAEWKHAWLLLNTAAMGATHNMHVTECNITPTSGGVACNTRNMCAGLNNPTWCAGKILCCSSATKAGLDDIQLKLGWNFSRKEKRHAAVYVVATAPTGIRPKSEILFEPLVGTKHWSLGGGLNVDYVLSEYSDYRCALLADVKYRYVFRATERRSFDLCANGPWSRYLQVVREDAPFNSMPGINFFTRDAAVTPQSTVDAWAALHFEFKSHWDLEIGYNLFWRQQEKIEFACCDELRSICCDNQVLGPVGIFDMPGVCGTAVSASTATISQGFNQVASNTVFTPVTLAQFNLDSAAHPNVLTNKIYAAFDWHHMHEHYTPLLGLGGSYEFGNRNSFNQWAVWAVIGIDC